MSNCCFRLLICALVLAVGCRKSESPESAEFGRFEGEVIASWDDDGRNMTLREDFTYVDAAGRRWQAPAGSVVNGATIPPAFWTFIGGPFEGKYRNASVVHDVGCVEMTATWEDVHRMFYEACRCGGVSERTAKILYYAVYHFGPRWEPVTETVLQSRETGDGQVIQEEVTVKRMVRIDPPPPTLEEVEQTKALIMEENPDRSVIERIDRRQLRRRPNRGAGNRTEDSSSASSMSDKTGQAIRLRTSGAADRMGKLPEKGVGKRAAAGDARSALAKDKQQWAAEQVSRHLQDRAGQERPAEYTVERTEDGYRVLVDYLQLDEDGRPTGELSGASTVRLSADGKVLEMRSGK